MATLTSERCKGRKIGIVGSRRRSSANDMVLLCVALDLIRKPGDMIVSGGCEKGADSFAEGIARARGMSILIHYPRTSDKCDSRTGERFHERNTYIGEDCDILLAMVHPDRTGGTEDTVKKALYLGKVVYLLLDDPSLGAIRG